MNAEQVAYALYKEWNNTPDGALGQHYRLISRNSYTIDPKKPEPDALDLKKSALLAQTVAAYAAAIRNELGYAAHHAVPMGLRGSISVPRSVEFLVSEALKG